ncbi:MAG: hypothetical protein FWF90_05435 [Promicromonosporaceae bacterium]|nr:hypothetical protein [Promicromonosporaceae bacterium]
MAHYKIVQAPSPTHDPSEAPFDADSIQTAKMLLRVRQTNPRGWTLPMPGRLINADTGEEVMSWQTEADLPDFWQDQPPAPQP